MNGFEVQYYFYLALSYLLVRPMVTLLHQMGHFLVLWLIVSKGNIRVFIGTNGIGKAAWNLRLGRVTWSFHPLAFVMRGGICDYDQALNAKQLLLVTIMGPIFSFAVGLGIGSLIFLGIATGPWQALLLLISLLCIIDGFHALFFRYDFIPLGNQRITGNDGQILGWLIRFRSLTDTYLHAVWSFEHDFFADAWLGFEKIIAAGYATKEVYESQSYCAFALKKWDQGLQIHQEMASKHRLEANDLLQLAKFQHAEGDFELAMQTLESGLATAPGNSLCLNEKGYMLALSGELKHAKKELNKAIINEPEFSLAYTNRAWIYIQDENWDAAHEDLQKAAKNDAENVFFHRNWAILHHQMGKNEAAKQSLDSAKLLGLGAKDYESCLAILNQI